MVFSLSRALGKVHFSHPHVHGFSCHVSQPHRGRAAFQGVQELLEGRRFEEEHEMADHVLCPGSVDDGLREEDRIAGLVEAGEDPVDHREAHVDADLGYAGLDR